MRLRRLRTKSLDGENGALGIVGRKEGRRDEVTENGTVDSAGDNGCSSAVVVETKGGGHGSALRLKGLKIAPFRERRGKSALKEDGGRVERGSR